MTSRRGLSMVETVVSLMVVGVLLAAALNTVGATMAVRQQAEDMELAAWLAQDLMAEILAAEYGDENVSATGEEMDDGDREDFEEVNDFQGLVESPPVMRDGTAIPWAAGLTRSVMIVDAHPQASGIEGLAKKMKCIRVTVSRGSRTLIAIEAASTQTQADAWSGP